MLYLAPETGDRVEPVQPEDGHIAFRPARKVVVTSPNQNGVNDRDPRVADNVTRQRVRQELGAWRPFSLAPSNGGNGCAVSEVVSDP